jgi:hypothetical protein
MPKAYSADMRGRVIAEDLFELAYARCHSSGLRGSERIHIARTTSCAGCTTDVTRRTESMGALIQKRRIE